MFKKEVIYKGGNAAICSDYFELEIKYYFLCILIYSITKNEKE